MNIGLLGYGKMGREIEKIALERGHNIVLRVDSSTKGYNFENVDVAVEFTRPESAVINIKKCIDSNIPVIVGTTGWQEKYQEIVDYCNERESAFLYASNFSIGVNIFFEINRKLASMLKGNGYEVCIEEIHHLQKLDKPSGTAITLANDILEYNKKKKWSILENIKENLFIDCKREEGVIGTHIIKYFSEIDDIEIMHKANSRKGFALGAVIASEWILGKKGVFGMKDVIGI